LQTLYIQKNLGRFFGVVVAHSDTEDGRIPRRSFIKMAGALAALAIAPKTKLKPVLVPTHALDTFSIFWITDTQFLSESNPGLYRMMTNWIAANWSAYNAKLVIHTGDVVQTGAHQVEWQNANDAMTVLSDNQIPYTWCAGNHDDLSGGDPTSGWMGNRWAPAFDPSTVQKMVNATGYANWVGDFHDGMNTALSFTANGLDFLVINLEWNAGVNSIAWAESILDDPAFAGHHVIIAPHAYIDAWGCTDDEPWGKTLAGFITNMTFLMDQHPNVFLTLNGHFATDRGCNTAISEYRNSLMFDRQDCRDEPDSLTGQGEDDSDSTTPDTVKVGGATVTVLTFDTAANQVSVSTYDAFVGRWRDDENEKYSVTMLPVPR
jgi:hypothetical protein